MIKALTLLVTFISSLFLIYLEIDFILSQIAINLPLFAIAVHEAKLMWTKKYI